VIATPIATVAALARAARFGALVRSARQLETASKVNVVVLDKTGTLTTGRLVPVRFEPAPGMGPDELLALAASALRYSSHPVARAAIEAAREKALTLEDPEETIEVPGQGVRAIFAGRDGRRFEILAGRRRFAAPAPTSPETPAPTGSLTSAATAGTPSLGSYPGTSAAPEGSAALRRTCPEASGQTPAGAGSGMRRESGGSAGGNPGGLPAGNLRAAPPGGPLSGTTRADMPRGVLPEAATSDGVTVLYVARDGAHVGAIYFEDRVRSEAAAAVQAMRRMRVKSVHMLTGDRKGTAERVGRALGVDEVAAELMPEQKVSFVESLKRKGRLVAFVGDGINDAPALAAAHLGIAVGGAGNEVAMRTADVVLTSGDISMVPRLLGLAGTTRRVIGQNITLSIGVGLVALILAAAGWLPPVAASVVHNGAAAFVVANATRIL
ncbi:MAG: HAD-IC family P-type ATPase, partial [Planctomycetota bacterium]|nr:HAD-IC family P-type ATPase [Planctomycetota bacterium]